MSAIWHDYPKNGDATACCGRTTDELPLGDARTSDWTRVTCDGEFTPAVFAHEVYPHPSEWEDEPPNVGDSVKYHLARALALYPAEFDGGSRAWMDAINLHISERTIACHVIALHRGLGGQKAMDWAHANSCGDSPELIYDLAKEYGVPLDRIRPYALGADAEATP